MHLYTLSFLFVLLPVSALIFYLVRPRYKILTLFVISLYFMATLSVWWMLLMLGSVLIDFFLSKPVFLYGKGNRKAQIAFFASTVKNIFLFVGFSSLSQLERLLMPVGVLVYSFTSLGYMADLYNGETEPIATFYEYGLFCCFFGKLYVGPIISYSYFTSRMQSFRPSMTKISQGVVWFLHGLAKKIILADGVFVLMEEFRAIAYLDKTVVSVWMLVICNLFFAYYTLSGYSDMARGVGAIFGMDLPENFHYPLQADSVTDFFSRFNISANRFVRKYVYQALGAEDNGTLSTTLNILLITMIMGLWYGIRLTYMAWGMFLGIFIILETLFEERFFRRIHPMLRYLYTFAVVIISFAWYCSYTLSQAVFYLQTMFGMRTAGFPPGTRAGLINEQCLHLLASNWLLLLCCAVFCTNAVSYVGRRLQQRFPRPGEVLSLTSNLGLLTLVLAFLI